MHEIFESVHVFDICLKEIKGKERPSHTQMNNKFTEGVWVCVIDQEFFPIHIFFSQIYYVSRRTVINEIRITVRGKLVELLSIVSMNKKKKTVQNNLFLFLNNPRG